MNDYEAKIEARRERLLAMAQKMEAASNTAYKSAREMASIIPMGQPIMVGHYSEKRDRNYRARIWRKQDRCLELQRKAEYYRGLAAGVGNGGISSDDPDAPGKIQERIDELEKKQLMMKRGNAAIRRGKDEPAKLSALVALGMSEGAARRLLEPDFAGRIGFPDYALKNNNANIRRLKGRLGALQKRPSEDVERELDIGATYREDVAENRVMLIFAGKPAENVRAVLKRNGFKWSPNRGAWVRFLNGSGRMCAEWAVSEIRKLQPQEVKAA